MIARDPEKGSYSGVIFTAGLTRAHLIPPELNRAKKKERRKILASKPLETGWATPLQEGARDAVPEQLKRERDAEIRL